MISGTLIVVAAVVVAGPQVGENDFVGMIDDGDVDEKKYAETRDHLLREE